ncbi:hypothetical protein GCM10027275_33780 [Rhabdobacter roseus]|uniref:Uncharacterized protein n=1 Tax=Rhabdobacter roseus TaxID=1655419 RepID=A0A840U0J4_9BACT|nr:hypothetical protein [Rhabdobacter roseus]MBB5285399.1 hypothetical protein [Rhabdobacter roseus]
MENTHSFKLIDGTFTPTEAGTVILDLINSKIKHHNLEILNCLETGLGNALHSQKRIQDLEEVRQRLNTLLQNAHNNGMYLKINGSIEIELAEVVLGESIQQA